MALQSPPLGTPIPPPQGPVKMSKPFYKRKLVWLLGVVVLIVVIAVASKGSSTSTSTSAPAAGSGATSEAAAAPAGAGIGTAVRDGKFEFVVQTVAPGVPEIGTAPLTTKAQGEFIVVTVKVTNIGDAPQAFSGSDAKAFDNQGRELSASTTAAVYLPDSNSLFTPINPGNSVASAVVFDVPVGTVLSSIELHDSPFSGGVTVKL